MMMNILEEGPINGEITISGHRQDLKYRMVIAGPGRTHEQRGATRESCLEGIAQHGFEIEERLTATEPKAD